MLHHTSALHQSIPSPHHMSRHMMHHAHGGHSGHDHHHPMIIAHFSKAELDDLDDLQGGHTRDKRTGLRCYEALGEKFHHPHVQHYCHGGYAHGGHPHMDHMAHQGRFGDTELALIPHHMSTLLDHAIGGAVRNPHTGHKEYFLGGLLGGLKSILSPIASNALNGMRNLGSSVLSAGKNALSGLASGINTDAVKQGLVNGAIGGLHAYAGGADPRTALQQGAISGLSSVNNPITQGLAQTGSAIQSGQDWRGAMAQGARTGLNQLAAQPSQATNQLVQVPHMAMTAHLAGQNPLATLAHHYFPIAD